MNRGEIWLYAFGSSDKRRPVLVLSRQRAIDLLRTILVAPITSAAHGAPSEVQLGIEEGLKHASVVNLDQVQTVDQKKLHHFVGTVGPEKMNTVCRALMIATGCEG
ncbi:MAG TPA: type II toxin-antitoxin system PemK/MazF family toxin [Thermoanaerobaculia bacterium]|jgi:mRNA interferase MazF|nr:type II toxin-antitoxin system PemK/MazF family toxin [Thermoanaerobaculia bacterium]